VVSGFRGGKGRVHSDGAVADGRQAGEGVVVGGVAPAEPPLATRAREHAHFLTAVGQARMAWGVQRGSEAVSGVAARKA
jgi:hypothetical protein